MKSHGEEMLFICQDAVLDDAKKVNLNLQCLLKVIQAMCPVLPKCRVP